MRTKHHSSKSRPNPRRSHSIVIQETPQKRVEAQEDESEKSHESQDEDTTGITVNPERGVSMSLGNTPSPIAHPRVVSRAHLARDVKCLPSVEKSSSYSRSSRRSSTKSSSKDHSEYIPTPRNSDFSSSSTSSFNNTVPSSSQHTAESDTNHNHARTPKEEGPYLDLEIPKGLLQLYKRHPEVQRFQNKLHQKLNFIESNTKVHLTAINRKTNAVELHRLRDHVNTNLQGLSYIIDRYQILIDARILWSGNLSFARAQSLWQEFEHRLAEKDPASGEPGPSLNTGSSAPATLGQGIKARQLTNDVAPQPSSWNGKAEADSRYEAQVVRSSSVEASVN